MFKHFEMTRRFVLRFLFYINTDIMKGILFVPASKWLKV